MRKRIKTPILTGPYYAYELRGCPVRGFLQGSPIMRAVRLGVLQPIACKARAAGLGVGICPTACRCL